MSEKEFHINSVEQLSEVSDYLLSMRNEAGIIACLLRLDGCR